MNATSHAPLTAVLGPTNTGKTHLAVERMLAHQSGMIGFPLRLLAREVYDRVVATKGPERVALITGEEMILPRFADYFLCTVESMPLHREVAFLAIDEIQMCADPDRGHVFTDRLLRARGTQETMLLGADTIKSLLRSLLPKAEFVSRPRFSKLSALGPKKLSRLPRRSAVVAFSTDDVYAMAEILRRQKGGVAIVMGALSPRTRNAQVELYQNGDVDYLVATDAIGMGLNMDIDHVAFAALKKFDGRRFRQLLAAEIGQIAGRAGRHMTDGTFGSISGLDDGGNLLDSDMIERIETHRFEKLKNLYWRQSDLDFSSLDRLIGALEQRPARPEFLRAHEASDLSALKWLAAKREIRDKCHNSRAVERLWQACQIPDFRKVSPDLHAKLIGRIFGHLTEKDGKIPEDWIDSQVRRLDNIQGDIDTLAGRIAGIRIWTYISHRPGWLARPEHWAAETRRVEDALSDALHQRLTQRFVDRRTSVLLRELRQRGELMVDIEQGLQGDDVSVEGHHIGRLEGFSFHVDPAAAHEEQKTLRATAERALRQEVERRAQMLCQGGDGELSLDTARGLDRPRIKWRGATIADMDAGSELLAPKVSLMTGSLLDGVAAQQVLERLDHWVRTQVETLLEPLIRIRDTLKAQAQGKADVALTGTARGVAYRLVEELGVLPRGVVEEEVRSLDQPARRLLRLFGIRFGASYIFIPALLKPAPTDWRLVLWALRQEKDAKIPARPTPGMVWTPLERDAAKGFYRTCGFKTAGDKAVRIDMLERLADNVRPLGMSGKPFAVTPEIMGLVGLSGDDFANVMRVLGYAQKEVPATELHQPEPKPVPEQLKTEDGAAADETTAVTPPVEADTEAPQIPGAAPAAADENAAKAEILETAPAEAAVALKIETEAAAEAKPETAAEAPIQTPVGTPVETTVEGSAENAKPELVVAFIWQPKKRGARPHKHGGGKPAEGKKFAKGPKDAKGAEPQGKYNKPGGKKTGKRPGPAAKAPPPPPKHSPFAALASLKEQLKR